LMALITGLPAQGEQEFILQAVTLLQIVWSSLKEKFSFIGSLVYTRIPP